MKRVTNANFAGKDERFKACCEVAGVEATKRQASKFRRGIGRAARANTAKVNQLIINRTWRD